MRARARRRGALVLVTLVTLASVLSACAVDFVLFNGQPLERYLFDEYPGEMLDRAALDVLPPLAPGAPSELEIESGEETLAAVLLNEPGVPLTPDDTLLVYFHGSARHLDYYWARVRLLAATGYPTLAVDYRGYGMSTGSTDVPSLLEDARATLTHAREALGDPRIVLVGNSIGSLAAARMAAEGADGNRIAALILEVPPNSLETAVADQFGATIPAEALFDQNVSVRDDALRGAVPLLLFSADGDEVFPPGRHADVIWSAHQSAGDQPGQRLRVPGGHDAVPAGLGYDAFVDTIASFVAGL